MLPADLCCDPPAPVVVLGQAFPVAGCAAAEARSEYGSIASHRGIAPLLRVTTAKPAYRSRGGQDSSAWAGRHWLTGTRPGRTGSSFPNMAVTSAWVRAVTGTGVSVLYAFTAAAISAG